MSNQNDNRPRINLMRIARMVKAANTAPANGWLLDWDAFVAAPLMVKAAIQNAKDKAAAHDPAVCECCECHGHEYTIESAEPVGDENAWVAVCDHCGFTTAADFEGDCE